MLIPEQKISYTNGAEDVPELLLVTVVVLAIFTLAHI